MSGTDPTRRARVMPAPEVIAHARQQPALFYVERLGVSKRTAERWRAQGMPRAAARACEALCGELGAIDGAWRGWAIAGGRLVSPEGVELSPGECRALPLLEAAIREYRAERRERSRLPFQPDFFDWRDES